MSMPCGVTIKLLGLVQAGWLVILGLTYLCKPTNKGFLHQAKSLAHPSELRRLLDRQCGLLAPGGTGYADRRLTPSATSLFSPERKTQAQRESSKVLCNNTKPLAFSSHLTLVTQRFSKFLFSRDPWHMSRKYCTLQRILGHIPGCTVSVLTKHWPGLFGELPCMNCICALNTPNTLLWLHIAGEN